MATQNVFVDTKVPTVCVHPVVVLSILDHHTRRNHDQKRVIGTLLGSVVGGVLEVRNSFPVPHVEKSDPDAKSVDVDVEFLNSMFAMHAKVSPKDVIVGWYSTGGVIDEYSSFIHEFYCNEVARPVHLCVNPTIGDVTMSVRAYTGTQLSIGGKNFGMQFEPACMKSDGFELDQATMDALFRRVEGCDLSSNTPLLADLDALEQSMQRLLVALNDIESYVKRVCANEVKADKVIGRYLSDTVASVPLVSNDTEFSKVFSVNLQDQLMVVYLANLTRTQISLAERLQTVV